MGRKKAQKAQTQGVAGNTNATPKKRDDASKYWCFTLPNYTESELNEIITFFKKDQNNKFIIGREVCPETKTPHLQGFIILSVKARLSENKQLNKRIHWEIKGKHSTIEQNIRYCSKEDKNPILYRFIIPPELHILKYEELYIWQKKLLEKLLEVPDNRTINWYWEPNGKIGKTQFARYVSFYHGALYLNGKKADILFNCANEIYAPIYILGLSRNCEGHVSYDSLECLKDGIYMSGKYESKTILRPYSHIVVFANFPPDIEKLSKDRWNIYCIPKEEMVRN